MDSSNNPSSLATSSACGGGAEHSEQTGTELDQDYFVSDENSSCNSNDSSSYFNMPEYVTDLYLQALDGGDESNAALRQISGVYGPNADKAERDTNCNHNPVNYEPGPNEGCGCTGSYNGGAGAGSAVCDGCDGKPYESGFKDKKRDPTCCCCAEQDYQGRATSHPCSCQQQHQPKSYCGCGSQGGQSSDTYQSELANKKCTQCTTDYKYVPELPPPPPYCAKDDPNCCCRNSWSHPADSYEMIKNTDAQRYQGKGPDRSNFYADDRCDCPCPSNNSCSNNLRSAPKPLDWAEVRRSAYSNVPSRCSSCSPASKRREWMNEFPGATDVIGKSFDGPITMQLGPETAQHALQTLGGPLNGSPQIANLGSALQLDKPQLSPQVALVKEEKEEQPESRCRIA